MKRCLWCRTTNTTNQGGAGKFTPACSRHFAAGAKVVVIADDDRLEQDHAECVTRRLQNPAGPAGRLSGNEVTTVTRVALILEIAAGSVGMTKIYGINIYFITFVTSLPRYLASLASFQVPNFVFP